MAKKYPTEKHRALVQKIRAVDYNVRRRLARVQNLEYEKIAGQQIEKRANETYNRTIKNKMSNLSELNYHQLTSLYADLQNINRMESSRVQGYKTMYKSFRPILERIVTTAPENRQKANRVLELLQSHYGSLYEKFKYSAYAEVYDEVESGKMSETEIADKLIQMYDELILSDGVDTDDFTAIRNPSTDNEREYQSQFTDW